MVVVAGAAAVVCKIMVGGVLDVLVAALKQNPYTLQRPVQHRTHCAHQPRQQQQQQQSCQTTATT